MRTALITGGSKGLGKMTATILAESGWNLAIVSRSAESKVSPWIEAITSQNQVKVKYYQSDVKNRSDILQVVEQIYDDFGRIDTLVHAIGPFLRERKLFIDHTEEEITELINGNLMSSLWFTHAVLPIMRKQKYGRFIYFGFGRIGEAPAWPDRSVYAIAKTGLVTLVKTLAVEEAVYGITANMIGPGDIIGEKKEYRRHEVIHLTDEEAPRGRPGSGEDVARVIRFLVAEESDFVTGNIINVTGGLDVISPRSKKQVTHIDT